MRVGGEKAKIFSSEDFQCAYNIIYLCMSPHSDRNVKDKSVCASPPTTVIKGTSFYTCMY